MKIASAKAARWRDKLRLRNAARKKKGLCIFCPANGPINHARSGKVGCAACAEKNLKHATTYRGKRKANGLCAYCGKRPRGGGRQSCDVCCEEREKTRMDRWRLGRLYPKVNVYPDHAAMSICQHGRLDGECANCEREQRAVLVMAGEETASDDLD